MEKKDYVSLDVAKTLAQKGYRKPSRGVYQKIWIDKEEVFREYVEEWKYDTLSKTIIAPSLYEAQQWLREKHKIAIEPRAMIGDGVYIANIKSLVTFHSLDTESGIGYEEALNLGIKRALKYI